VSNGLLDQISNARRQQEMNVYMQQLPPGERAAYQQMMGESGANRGMPGMYDTTPYAGATGVNNDISGAMPNFDPNDIGSNDAGAAPGDKGFIQSLLDEFAASDGPVPDRSGGGDLGMSYSKAPDMSQYASGQGLLGMNPQFAQVQPQEQMNLQGNPARNKFLQSLLGG
jgi:hypothetical protein